ncbi:MAG: SoxR reducing system RseC family protein [Deltaproteobacteria bacterium]|nr:SoxR reducing system RseC family protein [Deltaproteobacteria bacterium]MBW2112526.1 SoxR reducing system RseC family protein [Deltaproteobacteria bacterium]MBW2351664.1 SoxR reducing system RseC family protein [Deltaproteobacteria bacterium]HDZ89618.1 hypothetical protein [Deltaproteobacteria bacterium]
MPSSEGLVTCLLKDGRAEVIIYTDQPGIPDAPGAKVCDHCSECTARITVEVLNTAGALVGDRVSLAHNPGARRRSVRNLVGVPLVGLSAGLATGMVLGQTAAGNPMGMILPVMTGLLTGIVTGIMLQQSRGNHGLPFIDRILKSDQVKRTCQARPPVP